jgi:hypothetical protein
MLRESLSLFLGGSVFCARSRFFPFLLCFVCLRPKPRSLLFFWFCFRPHNNNYCIIPPSI